MVGTILSIVGSALGIVAAWFIGRFLVTWFNKYYLAKDQKEIADLKKEQGQDSTRLENEIDQNQTAEDKFNKEHP